MLTPLDQLIPKVLNTSSDWRLQLLQNWNSIVGSLKTRICLEHIYGTILVIGVYENHWLQELNALSRVLMATINMHLGQEKVTQLKFRLIEAKKKHLLPKPAKLASIQADSVAALTAEQARVLAIVQDEQLRKVLVSFLMRCTS